MNLTDLAGARFQLAIDRFAAGHSFTYLGIGFRLDLDGSLECEVPSSWSIENVTEATADADLSRAEQVLAELIGQPAFSTVTSGRPVRMVLIGDYGNGAVTLCTRAGSAFAWTPGLPRNDEGRELGRNSCRTGLPN
jgi:hypothetical protein